MNITWKKIAICAAGFAFGAAAFFVNNRRGPVDNSSNYPWSKNRKRFRRKSQEHDSNDHSNSTIDDPAISHETIIPKESKKRVEENSTSRIDTFVSSLGQNFFDTMHP